MFLIINIHIAKILIILLVSLNPLNQVYVFNMLLKKSDLREYFTDGLNPLNQVYVFNESWEEFWSSHKEEYRLNPLNQVYVFNREELRDE